MSSHDDIEACLALIRAANDDSEWYGDSVERGMRNAYLAGDVFGLAKRRGELFLAEFVDNGVPAPIQWFFRPADALLAVLMIAICVIPFAAMPPVPGVAVVGLVVLMAVVWCVRVYLSGPISAWISMRRFRTQLVRDELDARDIVLHPYSAKVRRSKHPALQTEIGVLTSIESLVRSRKVPKPIV